MILLEPAMLWGLLGCGIPLLLHLLSKARYRRKLWAASMFLMQARHTTQRLERIQKWLALLFRLLLLSLVALALSRPLLNPEVSWWPSPAPSFVYVILDTSASMASLDSEGRSNFSHALRLLKTKLEAHHPEAFTLLTTQDRHRKSFTLNGADGLIESLRIENVPCPVSEMVVQVLDAIAARPEGGVELWIISDGQASDWDSPAWPRLTQGLRGEVKLTAARVWLSGEASKPPNRSLVLESAPESSTGEDNLHHLALRFRIRGPALNPLRLTLETDGQRETIELVHDSDDSHHLYRLRRERENFMGTLQLPDDANPHDNKIYFHRQSAIHPQLLLVAEDDSLSDIFAAAHAAAAPHWVHQSWTQGIDSLPETFHDAIVIQGHLASRDFQDGLLPKIRAGTLLILYPSRLDPIPPDSIWSAHQPTLHERLLSTNSSPLLMADQSGEALPVHHLEALRTNSLHLPISPPTASLSPLFSEWTLSAGKIVAFHTLPHATWSNLGDGILWIPLLSRAFEQTERNRSREYRWLQADAAVSPDLPPLHLGTHTRSGRNISINLPLSESDQRCLSPLQIRNMLGGVPWLVDRHASDDILAGVEVWTWILLLGLFILGLEIWTLLPSPATRPQHAG